MTINSLLQNNAVSSMLGIASASHVENPKNITSVEDNSSVTVEISEQARTILNTSSKQVLSESIDNAWERIKDNEITKKINTERKKLYEFIPDVTYIQPRLKPWYFREAFEYNSKIAKAEAQKVVDAAAEKGISLNFNVVFQEFKMFNGICPEADYEVCLHRFESKQIDITVETPPETMTCNCYGIPDYIQAGLTDEEKAIFEKMHNYASSNGISTSQIDELLSYYKGNKEIRQYFGLPPQPLKEYMGQLVKMVGEGYESKRFNLSAIDILLKNFDKFDQVVKDETASGRA